MNITEDSKQFRFYIDEEVLQYLGFSRKDVSIEESACDRPFYFYTKKIGEYLTLISSSNDIESDANLTVSILECGDSIIVKHASRLEQLIKLLKQLRNEK
jgi:hypothetical protein